MVSKSICVDTNILIDIFDKRPRLQRSISIIKNQKIYATSHAIATTYYVIKKTKVISNSEFYSFVQNIHVVGVDSMVLDRAFELAGDESDLEDAVQVAACLQAGVTRLATADKKMAKKYGTYLDIELVA